MALTQRMTQGTYFRGGSIILVLKKWAMILQYRALISVDRELEYRWFGTICAYGSYSLQEW